MVQQSIWGTCIEKEVVVRKLNEPMDNGRCRALALVSWKPQATCGFSFLSHGPWRKQALFQL
jgi:hypothetical protein